jgi:hypothetical protein
VGRRFSCIDPSEYWTATTTAAADAGTSAADAAIAATASTTRSHRIIFAWCAEKMLVHPQRIRYACIA